MTFFTLASRTFYCVFVPLIFFAAGGTASADHFGPVFEQHELCVATCETAYEREEDRIGCSYSATQSALRRCIDDRNNAFRFCTNGCDGTRADERGECRQTRRAERRECRETAREDRPECRADRRVTIDGCNDTRRVDLDACDGEATGRLRRQCRRAARQTARECRQLARLQSRNCRRDTRQTRRECLDTANDIRDACFVEADLEQAACRAECAEVRDNSCLDERAAANLCAEQTQPARDTLAQCTRQCDTDRDAQLEGYNPLCSNGHAGEEGAKIAIVNNTTEVRFLYINNSFVARMNHGDQIVRSVPCDTVLEFDFKARQSADDLPEERSILPALPCCEEEQVETRTIIANE